MKTGKDIRQEFISFFEEKGHRFVRSSPVVPIDDPTLLFTNAGMNQFKPIFLDQEKPKHKRVVNTQKCIRVSGKHNDLEEVGVDNYHHTFFEMLGNWSFGDYYKAEAIAWAWELFTAVWGMEKERLWATVHETDDEAAQLWAQVTDLPSERVLRFGDKDNFWEMGETGPCGPCSEIHYYDGPDISRMKAEGVNAEPAFKELWNLVFIQNNRRDDGSLEELPAKHVDTGAGLERIVAVIQGKDSNYATDLFTPIIDHIAQITGVPYTEGDGIAHRVLADHVRMLAFSLADGALPSNEGRGYVVRRILRRAARFAHDLGCREPVIYRLIPALIDVMGEAYPELVEKRQHIERTIKAEESKFSKALDRGLVRFDEITRFLDRGDTIPGDDVFFLETSIGFPSEITAQKAREMGFEIDWDGFNKAMKMHRVTSKDTIHLTDSIKIEHWRHISSGETSCFVGYKTDSTWGNIRKCNYRDKKDIEVILDRTPFYAEAGGQVSDVGTLRKADLLLNVFEVERKFVGGKEEIVHHCELIKGKIKCKEKVLARVDREKRSMTMANHTATHLLHSALKQVLGEQVQQNGSLVEPERLRFDLTHYEKVTDKQVREIELIVNREIRSNKRVRTAVMSFDEARESGAVALFDEKYGDEVRVVGIPGFSKEFCGGTHVKRTGDIGVFKITHESALAAGVRRIEAVTGKEAIYYILNRMQNLQSFLELRNIMHDDLIRSWERDQEDIKGLERQLKAAQKVISKYLTDDLAANAGKAGDVSYVAERVDITESDQFKDLAVDIKHRLKSAVVVLGAVMDSKPQLVVAVTDDLKAALPAGEIAKRLGRRMGGGGGGTPILGTAGGKNPAELDAALSATPEVIAKALRGSDE